MLHTNLPWPAVLNISYVVSITYSFGNQASSGFVKKLYPRFEYTWGIDGGNAKPIGESPRGSLTFTS